MPAVAWATPSSDSRWRIACSCCWAPASLLDGGPSSCSRPARARSYCWRVTSACSVTNVARPRWRSGRLLAASPRRGADVDQVGLGVDRRGDRLRQRRRRLAVADLLGGGAEHVGGHEQLADGGELARHRVDVAESAEAMVTRLTIWRSPCSGWARARTTRRRRGGAEREREDQPAPAAHGVDVATDLERLVGPLPSGRAGGRAPVGGFVVAGLDRRHRLGSRRAGQSVSAARIGAGAKEEERRAAP